VGNAARILLQLDSDTQPSVFDAVVAIDAGVVQLLRHGGVHVEQVRDLVYGALFTRSPQELKSTAIFVGGSAVAAAEKLFDVVKQTFFGPFHCSVLFDANGANTTAAAAVLSIERHVPLAGTTLLVLGGTGPVGQRVARLAARSGARVRIGSRQQTKADDARARLAADIPHAELAGVATGDPRMLQTALEGVQLVVAAGAPGATLLPADIRRSATALQVAVDLNAVPPLGIQGVEATDKAATRDNVICYGAIGVGGLKMKIHARAIQRLFESNDAVLDAEEILAIGRDLVAGSA
jgi:methylenetetrahydrofolate/methylenetetrahydromethanopterin dehydrogenase (NADP+)